MRSPANLLLQWVTPAVWVMSLYLSGQGTMDITVKGLTLEQCEVVRQGIWELAREEAHSVGECRLLDVKNPPKRHIYGLPIPGGL